MILFLVNGCIHQHYKNDIMNVFEQYYITWLNGYVFFVAVKKEDKVNGL